MGIFAPRSKFRLLQICVFVKSLNVGADSYLGLVDEEHSVQCRDEADETETRHQGFAPVARLAKRLRRPRLSSTPAAAPSLRAAVRSVALLHSKGRSVLPKLPSKRVPDQSQVMSSRVAHET